MTMLLTCHSLVHHLTEFEEGALPVHDRVLVRMHIALCANCRRYRAQLLITRRTLAALGAPRVMGESLAAFRVRARTGPSEEPGTADSPRRLDDHPEERS